MNGRSMSGRQGVGTMKGGQSAPEPAVRACAPAVDRAYAPAGSWRLARTAAEMGERDRGVCRRRGALRRWGGCGMAAGRGSALCAGRCSPPTALVSVPARSAEPSAPTAPPTAPGRLAPRCRQPGAGKSGMRRPGKAYVVDRSRDARPSDRRGSDEAVSAASTGAKDRRRNRVSGRAQLRSSPTAVGRGQRVPARRQWERASSRCPPDR